MSIGAFINVLFCLASAFVVVACKDEGKRVLTSLGDFWKIESPTLDNGGDNIKLDYVFNDMVVNSMITWTYWDKNCKEGGNSLTTSGVGYDFELSEPESSLGDGTGTRGYSLSLISTSDVAGNTDIFSGDQQDENGSWYPTVDICARVALSTTNDIEVNFVETIISIQYEFTDGSLTVGGVNVIAPEVEITEVAAPAKLKAAECSASDGPITQGSVIKVCVDPGAQGIKDGYRMKEITSFTYTKIGDDGVVIASQVAVTDSAQASNGFTKLVCVQGSPQCSIDTLLLGDFYTLTGKVDASGSATIQFGDQIIGTDRRRLQADLQEDFEMVFEVIASSQEDQDANRMSWIDESNTGPGLAGIGIIVLLVLDIGTLFVLIFQHSFFKGMWFYL